MPLIVTQAIKM